MLVLGDGWLATASPWFGVADLTFAISGGYCKPAPKVLFLVVYAVAAAALASATRATFDRCLGRVEGHYPLGHPTPPSG